MTLPIPEVAGVHWERLPDGIASIRIARPPVNALNWELKRGLMGVIDAVRTDRSVRVLLISSELDRIFCAGSDLYELSRDHDRPGSATERTEFELDLWQRISGLPQPSIAIVEGHALGSGLKMAIACDFRVAGASASFGLPEIKIGGAPGIQTLARLPLLVGLGEARRMLLLGETVSAARAIELRLIDELTPAGEAFDAGLRLARRLSFLPESSTRFLKAALAASSDAVLGNVAPAVLGGVEKLFLAPEMHEGIQAFLEKRSPDFVGAATRSRAASGR